MALALALLSLLPVFVGFMTTGDFSQFVFKPSLGLVQFVFRFRYMLIGLSILLYLSAIIVHLVIAPTNIALLIVIGILALMLTYGAFFAEPMLIFPAIQRHPTWISSEQAAAELASEDLVLVIEVNGDVRAYPVKWITRPHIVRDSIGGEPVIMTYCALSNLGKAFGAERAGKEMNLAVTLQLENNLVYYDRTSNQLIQQINGAVLCGNATGKSPTEYPTRMIPWSACRTLYPAIRVFYNPPRGLVDHLVARMLATIVEPHLSMESKRVAFPTIKRFDARLHPKSRVIGVERNGIHKAYSFAYLTGQQVINDVVGDLPIVVVYDSVQDIGDVFERTHQGTVLTFHLVPTGSDFLFQDDESQSQWNIKGEAITGPAQGQRLRAYPHASRVLWMIWYNFFPDTQLDGYGSEQAAS
jgi:hypothetical protein